jgi:hypothetical protein
LSRLLALLFAGAILVAPVVGIAHAIEHQGAVDSVDCGTCHWSKNITATTSAAPAIGIATTVEVVRAAAPRQPNLHPQVSEQHTRGPPAACV